VRAVLVINNGVIVADNTPEALSSRDRQDKFSSHRGARINYRLLKAHDGSVCEYVNEGEPARMISLWKREERGHPQITVFKALGENSFHPDAQPIGASLRISLSGLLRRFHRPCRGSDTKEKRTDACHFQARLQVLFHLPIGYVFCAIFLCLFNLFFYLININYNNAMCPRCFQHSGLYDVSGAVIPMRPFFRRTISKKPISCADGAGQASESCSKVPRRHVRIPYAMLFTSCTRSFRHLRHPCRHYRGNYVAYIALTGLFFPSASSSLR
jgi:hypothetical protein